jgi:hypothetical protein
MTISGNIVYSTILLGETGGADGDVTGAICIDDVIILRQVGHFKGFVVCLYFSQQLACVLYLHLQDLFSKSVSIPSSIQIIQAFSDIS